MKNRILFVIFLILFSSNTYSSPAIKTHFGAVTTLILTGTYKEMGMQYGQAMKSELHQALTILENFYAGKGVSYNQLVQQAELFYQRFPYNYKLFLSGEAVGANLTFDDLKILNAMETLGELLKQQPLGQCAYLAIPAAKTQMRGNLIGRNYDFPPPFDQLSKFLTITILKEPNSIPTAFIALAGEIYCPSCVNKDHLFMELNNGMPSGGFVVDQNRQSLLINMLEILQNSINLPQLKRQLNTIQSDYSLIVNAADQTSTSSFEFSSTLGMKSVTTEDIYASTNFYLNPDWKNIPIPTDKTTWFGVTRRNNLLNLASQTDLFNIEKMENLMDKTLQQGGAAWETTIYQFILDVQTLELYVKINKWDPHWQKIPLKSLFGE